jgi:hypothetical protein
MGTGEQLQGMASLAVQRKEGVYCLLVCLVVIIITLQNKASMHEPY